MSTDSVERARTLYLERFSWIDGIADTWAPLRDPATLDAVIRALADLVAETDATVVLGIEARGFVFGPAVARAAGLGFTAVRKSDGILPGDVLTAQTGTDYRGHRHMLRLRSADLHPGDRVVLVDDWIETGSQATTTRALAERAGATWAGGVLVVDRTTKAARRNVGPIRALLARDQLPPE